MTRNLIFTTLNNPVNCAKIMNIVPIARNITDLAVHLCIEFEFVGANKEPQIATCTGALRSLEEKGLIKFPETWAAKERNWQPTFSDSPIALPTPPEHLSSIEGSIEVSLVATHEDMVAFNTLVKESGNDSFTKLPPMAIHYLIKSPDGIIGAVGFSSANFNNAARERFIGWNREEKDHYLHYVANLRIFYIRKGYTELGSLILDQALSCLKYDYKYVHGIELMLVEAVVPLSQVIEFSRHSWNLASSIKPLKLARGEININNIKKNRNTDSVFIYEYHSNFREILTLHMCKVEKNIEQYMQDANWVDNELNQSSYDKRLLVRTRQVIENKMQAPSQSFLQNCNGSRADQKGYYRLIETKNTAYNFSSILRPSIVNTGNRASDYPVVVWASDGSDLNYAHLPHCKGLGMIGTKNQVPGLHLHVTLGLTPDELVLGIGHATCGDIIHRTEKDKGRSAYIALENKNSYIWYIHAQQVSELMCGYRAKNIFTCDRGADDYGLYVYIGSIPNLECVIRSQYNRKLEGETDKLHDLIRKLPSMGRVTMEVSTKRENNTKKSNRGKKKRKAKMTKYEKKERRNINNFGKREVTFNVAYKKVNIKSPKGDKNLPKSITLTAIRAWEANPIPRKKAKEWILLTTLPINNVDDAIQCIKYYRSRWRVEELFRMLKSGCHVEKVYFDTCERIKRSIAINLIVAWRLLFIGLLGGKLPLLPPGILFTDIQIRVLKGYAIKYGCSVPKTLDDALALVGLLGGACLSKAYPQPGYMSIVNGFHKLKEFEELFKLYEIGYNEGNA